MRITEKEIFKYIFYGQSIPADIVEEIEGSGKYQDMLNFYTELKSQFNKIIPDETKKKLANRIKEYKPDNTVLLIPVNFREDLKSVKLIKYAAATQSDNILSAITFVDENNHYIIRLNKVEEKYKLYVFSTLSEGMRNFKIRFYPSNEIIGLKDNNNPVSISLNQIPEKIEILLN